MSYSVTSLYFRWPRTLKYEGGKRLINKKTTSLPKVTIITVCYQAEQTVEQTLLSVFSQSFTDYEFIIIDGGSRDGTLDIIKRYENRIDYIMSAPDDGIYDAMNRGLALARGQYILFLNADDWYVPDAVQSLVSYLEQSNADFVSAGAMIFDGSGRPLQEHPKVRFDASALLRMPLRHETMLVSAKIYNELGGYDKNYQILSDRKFTAELFLRGYQHALLDKIVLNFRNSGISNTTRNLLLSERLSLLKIYFPTTDIPKLQQLADLEHMSPNALFDIVSNSSNDLLRSAALNYAAHRGWTCGDILINRGSVKTLRLRKFIRKLWAYLYKSFQRSAGNR